MDERPPGGADSRLVEPVGLGSRMGPCPGVRYSEVGGVAVLWEPRTGVLHELTPASAALWGTLDGRPLAEGLDRAAGPMAAGDRARFERDAVEVVRRLRAGGLIEDLEAGSVPPDAGITGTPPSVVRLAGQVMTETRIGTRIGGVVVVLHPAVGPDGEAATDVVDVEITPAGTGDVDGPAVGAQVDGRTVAAFAVSAGGDRRPTGAEDQPLDPVRAVTLLAELMGAVPADPAPHPLVLDALASVAESVPGFVAG